MATKKRKPTTKKPTTKKPPQPKKGAKKTAGPPSRPVSEEDEY